MQPVRYPAIDGLRALAALAVVLFHVLIAAYGLEGVRAVRNWLDLGYFGVSLFFLISGLLIQHSVQRTPPGRFWIRRFFRLFPLYWASMLCALMFAPLLGIEQISVTQVLANATMLQRLFGQDDLIDVYWTLGLEMLFYMLTTIIVILKGQHSIPIIVFFLLCGALVTDGILPIVTGTVSTDGISDTPMRVFANLATMFFGYMYGQALTHPPSNRRWWIIICALWLAVTVACSMTGYSGDMIARSCAFGLFFLISTQPFALPALLAWLGKISYSLYLLHMIVIAFVFQHESIPYKIPVALLLSIAVAGISYYAIEQPGIRLGERLQKRIAAAWRPERSSSI